MSFLSSTTRLAILWLGLSLASLAAETGTITKSESDTRDYAGFVLPNGLEVVTVSDPTSDKAAASLDVHVGSGADPEGREGLAHFLEHMLFLGTEKYPDPTEYKAFITSHGGQENAYTSFDHTNYFFEVNHDQLEPALERFAQFFIGPRFDPEYVSRERQVVHSEYMSRFKSDGRRGWHAAKQAMNPGHTASRFAVGSLETLADRPGSDIRDELIAFYRAHYSAGIMKLAVVGREPVSELRAMVEARFAQIPNTGAAAQRVTAPLFAPGTLPARLDVQPVREQRRLTFTFPVTPVERYWRNKPSHSVSDLLGHEGKGSLLDVLKARGWVESLGTGLGMSDSDNATYRVSVSLTQSGLEHVDDIGALLFRYIALVRDEGMASWRFDELQRLGMIHFRFEEKGGASSLARRVASDLHRLPRPEVLRGRYAMDEHDPDVIRRLLDELRPHNVLVTVTARDVQTDRKTDFYEVEYSLRPLSNELIEAWTEPSTDDVLALPAPNPFIPENLALVEPATAASAPVRVLDAPGLRLWHHQDGEFRLPRTDFYFSVRSPIANDSPRHSLLTTLFVGLVNDELNAYSYPADLAGMDYSLYKHMRGFSMRFSGYSDKEAMLIERVVSTLADPKLPADRFAIVRERLARGLRNASKRTPSRAVMSEANQLLVVPSWSDEELLELVDNLTLEALREFVPKLLGSIEVVALAHGNLSEGKALELAALIETALVSRSSTATVPSGQVVRLDEGDRYLRRIGTEHSDSGILVYYQGSDRSFETRARFALLGEVLSSPFFDVLRTELRLGYMVFSIPMSVLEAPGIAFVVQSPTADPPAIAGHIDSFIRGYAETMSSMPPRILERHKTSVVSRILESETRLDERTNRYWTEIDREHYEFDSHEKLARAVRAIELEEFAKFYDDVLLGPTRRAVVVEAGGAPPPERQPGNESSAARGASIIEDGASFKASKGRFDG